jgi:Spy/CpxP family protein refolding chaperone
MWKLTEELKLDQATAAKVFPVLAQFDEKGKQISKERWELARDVQDQVDGGKPDEARLRKLIDQLQANQNRRNSLDEERFKALRQALTPLQQAKLLLLLPRIEDDFRHRIREAIRAQKAQAEAGPGTRQVAPF